MMPLIGKPLNREPPVTELISSFLTNKDGYDRNHGSIPHLSSIDHVVKVDGAIKTPFTLTIDNLRNDYPQHSVVCALQCAGNRRHTMRTHLTEVQGIDCSDGAVMNCKWTGPLLRDVLAAASPTLDPKTAHIAFACHSQECQEDSWYGASIPLPRALDPDAEVVLALEMNGETLTPNHGFPVRVVTPGIAGARAVKWLDRITVQDTESDNHYMKRDYKILPPEATDAESAEKFWDSTPPLQEMPVNSVIAIPKSETTVARDEEGLVDIQGYAVPSGKDGPVVKVEVSIDDGEHWTDAEIMRHPDEGKWSWVLWRARQKMEPGKGKTIMSRATDKAGNVQEKEPQWNLRGCGYNGFGIAEDLQIL